MGLAVSSHPIVHNMFKSYSLINSIKVKSQDCVSVCLSVIESYINYWNYFTEFLHSAGWYTHLYHRYTVVFIFFTVSISQSFVWRDYYKVLEVLRLVFVTKTSKICLGTFFTQRICIDELVVHNIFTLLAVLLTFSVFKLQGIWKIPYRNDLSAF